MNIRTIPIAKIMPARYNPRVNLKPGDPDFESIKRSIEEFGFVEPLVWNEHNGVLVGGHQRLKVLEALGHTKVEVSVVNLSDRHREKALNLALNRIAGQWDDERLAAIIGELDGGFDMTLTGFSEREVAKILKDAAIEDTSGKADEIPATPKKPITKNGDLWKLGDHRLICGDAFADGARKTLIGNEPATMVVTDPPYAIYGSSTGVASSVADDKMVRPFFEQMFGAFNENLKKFGHAYIFCDWRSWSAIWESAKRQAITPKNLLVWDKGGGLGTNYSNTYELIGFFSRNPARKTMSGQEEKGHRLVMKPNLLRFNRPHGDERKHNAAKPVALVRELIENSSDLGDLVLDYFMGSGTGLIAAEQAGRRCAGFEIEPAMCDVIVERWETLTGKKAHRG